MSATPPGDEQGMSQPSIFRSVPRTGVIYVMGVAREHGYGAPDADWCNLGQGAPETGELPGAYPRQTAIPCPPESHEYAPVSGLRALREAVAHLYNTRYRQGMTSQYTAENVAISSGGRAGLTRAVAALGAVNLGHLLPDYTAYEELLDVFRAFVPIPIVVPREDGFRLSPELLRREIVGRGLGAVLLSNPCNPTGQLLHGSDLDQCIALSREMGCALILDEFYSHYVYGVGDAVSAVSAARHVKDVDGDRVLILDGLTKNWRYPGWRVSWTIGPREIISRIASAGSFLDGGAPHPNQLASVRLLDPVVADQEARAIQQTFGAKRRMVIDRLASMGIRVPAEPDGSFYCFACLDDLPEPLRDGMAFFRAAIQARVIVVPGVFFDVNPGKRRSHIPSRLTHFIRVSFGPPEAQIREGLDRLEAMIRSY